MHVKIFLGIFEIEGKQFHGRPFTMPYAAFGFLGNDNGLF